MKFVSLVLCMFLLLGCGSTPKTAVPVNVMLLIDESSSGALPAGHQASKALINGISAALTDSGLSVYDDAVFRLDDLGGNRFTADKAKLIELVRGYRGANIDYAIVITLDALVRNMSSSKRISTRSFGQTIDVDSGRVMGSFSDIGNKLHVYQNCRRTCLSGKLTDSAKSSIGPIAVEITSHIPQSREYAYQDIYGNSEPEGATVDYILVFEGFNRRELSQIEDYLVIFSGYEDMQYSHSSHRYAEIWYQSSISESKLSRNLNRMLDELRKEATMTMNGTNVHIRKLSAEERKPKFDLDGWE